jgi:hypothetical protein
MGNLKCPKCGAAVKDRLDRAKFFWLIYGVAIFLVLSAGAVFDPEVIFSLPWIAGLILCLYSSVKVLQERLNHQVSVRELPLEVPESIRKYLDEHGYELRKGR